MSKIASKFNKQKIKTKVNQVLPVPFLKLSRDMNAYSKEFIHKLESTCKFSLVLLLFKQKLLGKCATQTISSKISGMCVSWSRKNNVELDSKLKFKWIKLLTRHENAGIIR